MAKRDSLLVGMAFAALFAGSTRMAAQAPETLPVTRAVASRAEIQATLTEIDQILASPGYSGRLKAAKRIEAELLRQRLITGDFQTGDRVYVAVVGEPAVADSFSVTPSRTILIPNVAEFPLSGVLRSELQTYMTEQLSRFFRNPTVVTRAFIRLAIFGGVGAPGYYQLPADQLIGGALMAAGGPTGNANMEKSRVVRGAKELRSSDAVRDALTRGLTLDQFNLQAGDEIHIGARGRGLLENARGIGFAVGAVTSIGFLISRVF